MPVDDQPLNVSRAPDLIESTTVSGGNAERRYVVQIAIRLTGEVVLVGDRPQTWREADLTAATWRRHIDALVRPAPAGDFYVRIRRAQAAAENSR